MSGKARILFVDDEKRVLNSMRGLFRREYELFLTTVGADAVKIASENDVDVVVADQRMPGMTGIEVLGKIKQNSPRTIRILLTGYADPSAVEGSINIGEVFRFLSKPCPPKLLRETLTLAIEAARTQPVLDPPAGMVSETERATPTAVQAAAPAPARPVTTTTKLPDPPVAAEVWKSSLRDPDAPAVAKTSESSVTQSNRFLWPKSGEPSANDSSEPQSSKPVLTQASDRRVMAADFVSTAHQDETPSAKQTNEMSSVDAQSDDDATEPALPVLTSEEIRTREAAEARATAETQEESHWHSVTNVVLSEDTVEETQESVALQAAITQNIKDVGVVIFTVDSAFAETAIRALSTQHNTILATSLVKVAQAVEMHQAGVLLTDFTTNSAVLQKMIGALKQYMPELVTIIVSDGRDTTDMINLINYGQVFRYVLKPIEAGDLRNDVNAAAVRCLYLLNNPESVKRHSVIETPTTVDTSATLNRFLGRIRKIKSERSDSTDTASK